MTPKANTLARRTLPLRNRGFIAPPKRGILVITGLHGASATAIRNLIRFSSDLRPDRIVVLAPQHGWCDTTQRFCADFAAYLDALSQAQDNPIVIQTNSLPPPGGNELVWSRLCTDALHRNNAVLHTGILPIAPGWYSLCANEGATSGYPGSLAISIARALGASVICGGTNELASIGQSQGPSETAQPLWGIEVGTVRAGRARRGAPTAATPGFVIVDPDGTGTAPTIVPIDRHGSFAVAGVTYA